MRFTRKGYYDDGQKAVDLVLGVVAWLIGNLALAMALWFIGDMFRWGPGRADTGGGIDNLLFAVYVMANCTVPVLAAFVRPWLGVGMAAPFLVMVLVTCRLLASLITDPICF